MVFQTKTSIIGILLASVLMISCSQRNTGITTIDVDVAMRPMIHSRIISGLISDSTGTHGRFETNVWDSYSNDTADYWYFPEGIYYEKFDSLFQVSEYIRADTAYYFNRLDLWHLIGNVYLKNITENTVCETSELFFNSREPANSRQAIYTDKFFTITSPVRVVTGTGLRSNQSMTSFVFYRNTLETEIDEDNSAVE